MKLLVTGARGFIGSAFIRYVLLRWHALDQASLFRLIAFARPTSEWARTRLEDHPRVATAIRDGYVKVVYGDLTGDISGLCEGITAVVHFAAKTYVDHSIKDPVPFVMSNVIGTTRLLDEARRQGVRAFIHVSTDEVYGQILEGSYAEDSPTNPRNPYAASKAGADALTQAYYYTFGANDGMWTAVTRTENNYGPFQHPQKVIPVFIKHALEGRPLPVYGDGQHVRQWLNVDDHIEALLLLVQRYNQLPGGEIWHIAGNQEITNLELARKILTLLGQPHSLINLIDDRNIRPGHDRRYALSCDKLHNLGWRPKVSLSGGLAACVRWYAENRMWLD